MEQQKKDLAEAKQYAKKLTIVSLAANDKEKKNDDKEKVIDVVSTILLCVFHKAAVYNLVRLTDHEHSLFTYLLPK